MRTGLGYGMGRATGAAIGGLVALGLLFSSSRSLAQSPRADAAEALFRQAQVLGREDKWAEACEKFAASSALEPGIGTLLYLGDCYERTNRYASASAVFTQAADLAGKRGDTERQHVAAVRAAALEPRAPRLEVKVSADAQVPGLQVTLNGVPLADGELNSPQIRDQGEYEVEVSAPGYSPFRSRIELRNGATTPAILTVPLLVELAPAVPESASPPAPVKDRADGFFSQSTVGLLVGGGGILLAGAAGVMSTFAVSSLDESKDFCRPEDENSCSNRGIELRNEALDMAFAATIAGVASGLALAGGTYLYVSAPGLETGNPEAAVLNIGGSFELF